MANDCYQDTWDDIIDVIERNSEIENLEDEVTDNNLVFCRDCAEWQWFPCLTHHTEDEPRNSAYAICNICSSYDCGPVSHELSTVNGQHAQKLCSCLNENSTLGITHSIPHACSESSSYDSEVRNLLDESDELESSRDDVSEGEEEEEEDNFREDSDFETNIDVDDPEYYFGQSLANNFGIDVTPPSALPSPASEQLNNPS